MVYSSGGGQRYSVVVAAACVFILSAIPTARPQASDIDSGNGSVREASCTIFDGDKAFGIQVFTDDSCASGGLGCYNDHCRYCKLIDTLKSAHLGTCESFGASFSTMAPLTTSAGDCHVSSGDAAVGVGGMTDPSCLYGGIGCFNDHCRFCQIAASPQSSHFLLCSWFEDPSSSSGSPDGSAGDAGVIPSLRAENVTPTKSLALVRDATNSGQMDEALEATTASACTLTASDGDVAVGINITSDATCASGGVGCINSICRFCRAKDTTQAAHLNACLVVTKVCTTKVSGGDAAVGINIVTDASCAQGGLGCIDSVCRFCRTTSTTQSASYVDCASIGSSAPSTQTPVTTTPAPSTTAPLVVTKAPATTAPIPVKQTCSHTVSDGDAAVGIKIVTDTSCSSGGLGCIDQVCRFCRVITTSQSASFVDCATIVGASTTSVPATAAPTSTPAPTTAAPTSTPAPTTAAPTKIPAPTTATPVPTTTSPMTAPAPTATTAVPIAALCGITAAAGDIAAGISIVTDNTCASGGLGCIDTVCRFCRDTTSTQSAPYVDCAAITGITSTPTPTPTPTTTPASATTAATPSVVFVCSRTVSSGDKAVGLDVVSDIRCSEGGAGCLDGVCRFCKLFDTVQSQAYLDCSTIPSSDVGSDITFVPIPLVADPDTPARLLAADSSISSGSDDTTSDIDEFNTTDSSSGSFEATITSICTMTVSSGDAAVGINIVTDVSCSSGGTGCIDTVCRHCKNKDTAQSAHLYTCPSTATEATSTGTSISTDKVCMTTVSDGDASVGINIITDTNCVRGGLGCIDSVCRYCKTKSTDQSAHFGSCSDYSPTTTSLSTTTAPATIPPPATVVSIATTTAPTTAPVSIHSIPLNCYQTASSGDKSLGLDIVTDLRCGDGGVGCVDSICRFCKRFETLQSHSYTSCSDIPVSDNGADINFKTIVTDDTLAQESASDTLVALHESDEFTSAETEAVCSNVSLADGQAAGGIGVVLDTVHCPEGLAPGCIGGEGCRYCMRFPTNVSEYLEYCAIVNSTGVAYALSGLSLSIEDGSSRSSDAGSAGSLDAEGGDAVSVETRALNAKAPELLKSSAISWTIAAAACIGVVVVVGLTAFSFKRTIRSLAGRSARSSDKEKVSPNGGNRASVLITSNASDPGIISDV